MLLGIKAKEQIRLPLRLFPTGNSEIQSLFFSFLIVHSAIKDIKG